MENLYGNKKLTGLAVRSVVHTGATLTETVTYNKTNFAESSCICTKSSARTIATKARNSETATKVFILNKPLYVVIRNECIFVRPRYTAYKDRTVY